MSKRLKQCVMTLQRDQDGELSLLVSCVKEDSMDASMRGSFVEKKEVSPELEAIFESLEAAIKVEKGLE